MHYLTVATCIKGEDSYIDDFVRIHQKLGVDAFIFYDRDGDNLTDKFQSVPNITVIKFPEPQRHHESHLVTIRKFQGMSRWIAFIDCDQVLFPTNLDLKATLKEFEPYAQLQPVWQTFGDGGQETRTEGSVYERFLRRARDEAGINNHTQGVADISKAKAVLPPDPHRIVVADGQVSVDENRRNVGNTPHISPHTQNKIFVAHYISKSREEWQIKNDKMRADTGTRMDPQLFDSHKSFCNEVEDTRLRDFWLTHCK